MSVIAEKAPAKINWYLQVGDRRPDGYHTVVTLMQTVSLYDDVSLEITQGEGIHLTVTGNSSLASDDTNLAYRAAALFMKRCGTRAHIGIHLTKRIPVAAGLAGGSADAAAVLRACQRAFDSPLSDRELTRLGGELGSDVPFCLRGGLALCQGRGEEITPLAPLEPYALLLVNRGEPVSTREAYADLDRTARTSGASWEEAYRALKERDFPRMSTVLRNDFSPVVLPECPLASQALLELQRAGGIARMSGSGSTVFGIFPDDTSAVRASMAVTGNAIPVHTL